MLTKLAGFAVFSLIVMMIIPVYADVNKATINEVTFTIEDKFTISGTISDADRVTLLASMKGPGTEKLTRTTISDFDGTFSFVPVNADDLFRTEGTYTINVFTETQKSEEGTIIEILYEDKIATLLPDFVLELNDIENKQVDETEKLSFTASVTDSTIKGLEYSLEKHPNGATINKDTGVFSWTPTKSQAGGYVFDIVVNAEPLEDRKTISVTVNDKPDPITTQPTPTTPTTTEPEPKTSEPEPKTSEPEPKADLGTPAFVDPDQDPQYYVDRYNTESTYKDWFDKNYPEYESIYQAVGLEEPLGTPAFVDPDQDPQYYVDRYNTESTYKDWFDKNYPEYESIYQAVGLEEPLVEEPKIGECGEGTILINGICTPEKSDGGGCLIATATYGSEMAAQVQFLREIRDNQLMNTDSGASFMTGFNQLYYSFSPHIADMERENPVFKEMVKIGITPLLTSLSVMSMADSEEEILGYGIGVILMNLGMYVAAPVMIVYKSRKFIKI